MALTKFDTFGLIENRIRVAGQTCLDWHQQTVQRLDTFRRGGLQLGKRDHLRGKKRLNPESAQHRHMRAATQRFAQIVDQTAHIRTRAAFDVKSKAIAQLLDQIKSMHLHFTRIDFDTFTATRAFVVALTIAFECGIDRWNLLDLSAERRKRLFDPLCIEKRNYAGVDHVAGGIGTIGADAKQTFRFVSLARSDQQPGDLGRFAKAQWQQAGSQWIEASGMAALGSPEEKPRLLQSLV